LKPLGDSNTHKIYLAFLWHQHQPYYKDLKTGQAILPWARLHATKDYYDMAAILEEFPKIRLTINLVPSLLAQLEDYAQNRCTDPWLEKTLLPAKTLSPKDQCWILENFFFCNWDTKIFPNPRYSQLFEKRGKYVSKNELERIRTYFSPQDFLDLQVWFNLAWMDPLWQEKEPLISHLYKKGRDFSEGEKIMLIEKQKEICKLTIDKHKELWEKGQIELSTTPYYHPILPLLCDTDSAQMAMPGSMQPRKRFQHPEDAQQQIEKAVNYFEKIFGKKPIGMWPSEGSVSEEMIPLLENAGIEWAATDEAILFNSLKLPRGGSPNLKKEMAYQPFWAPQKLGEKKLQLVFRDHGLSDAIGFVYARTEPKKAVDDFLHRLVKILDNWHEDRPPLVPIILDGENCWEHYMNDGLDFLRILYQSLSDHPQIETTTIGNYINKFPAKQSLEKLWAGSWINADFSIWIGQHEDNRAWELVSEARDFLGEYARQHPEKSNDPNLISAWESLYIAEGSDWCWWYGDQNSTAHDEVFDQLFRNHLKNVYSFLNVDPPEKLNIAIKGKEQKRQYLPPVDFIYPKIDGLITNYYEWRSGGIYQILTSGGAMHQAENFLNAIYYGFDLENLYLRLDSKIPFNKNELDLSEIKIKISFLDPPNQELQIEWSPKEIEHNLQPQQVKAIFLNAKGETTQISNIAAKKIVELSIPFSYLGAKPDEPIEFSLTIIKNGLQIERWPHQSTILFRRPTETFHLEHWTV